MALLQPYMTKHVLSAKELEIAPESGQSMLVKDIQVMAGMGGGSLEAWIDQKSVAYFPDTWYYTTPLTMPDIAQDRPTILKLLASKGYNTTFPVADGQTFRVETSGNQDILLVEYELYDTGDITPDQPNGTNWAEWIMISYGTREQQMTVPGWYRIDKSANPGPYPDFPYSAQVPSGTQVDVLGFMFRNFEVNTYSGGSDTYGRSKYLRVTRGTKVLFDRDLQGFVVLGDGAMSGSSNEAYYQGHSQVPWYRNSEHDNLFLLPEPLSLVAGEDLTLEVYVDGDSGVVLDGSVVLVGTILRYRRIA